MTKVSKLVEDYNKVKKLQKPYDFKKHIVKTYLPYAEKLTLVKRVINSTSYVEVNGKSVYRRNTSGMLFIFFIGLIQYYTDIEIDLGKVNEEYDALMEPGILDLLISEIPESEINMLRSLLDMEREDLECNTRSLVSFLETKVEAFALAADSIAKVLEKPEMQAKIEKLMK